MTKYKFEDIAYNSTEKKKPVEEDKYTYIGLEHLDPQCLEVTRYGSEVAPIGEKLVMKKGDVLFGKRRAYQKKVAIAPFDGIFSAHGMVLRPKEKVIDPKFFPMFIASDYFLDAAIKISVGSLSPTINWSALKELEFELPDLNKQHELAELLWAAEETKQAYKNSILKVNDVLKVKYDELLYKYKDFPSIGIFNFGEISTGMTPSTKCLSYYSRNDIMFVKPADIEDGCITYINKSESYLSNDAKKVCRIMPKNSILVTCIGTIGKIGIATTELTCNQQINFIVPNEIETAEYIAYSLLTKKQELADAANKQVIPIINKSDFSKIQIPNIPIEAQIQFKAIVNHIKLIKKRQYELLDNINRISLELVNMNLSKEVSHV